MDGNLAYQDAVRDELIDGEMVLMSPRPARNHNIVAGNLFGFFWKHLDGGPCTPVADGMQLFLDEKNRFVPDFMIVCDENKLDWDGVHGTPDLVAEVLSPRTARYDRTKKMQAYEQAGVREYWIVNAVDKSIEQYVLKDGQFELQEIYTFLPDYMLEGMTEAERAEHITVFRCSLYDDLEIPLTEIFKRVK